MALTMLATIKQHCGDLEKVKRVVRLFGMANSASNFERQPAVIDGASGLFLELWRPVYRQHARSAVRMAELPHRIPVEINGEFELHPWDPRVRAEGPPAYPAQERGRGMRKPLPAVGALAIWVFVGTLPVGCGRNDPAPQQSSQDQPTGSPAPVQGAPSPARPQPGPTITVQEPLTPAQTWGLATSAVLWERNRDRHDTLGGMEPTEENIGRIKQILSQWWGVTSRETLLASLEWLDSGGHRREFEEMGAFVESLSGERYREILTKAQRNEELSHRVQIVKQYYGALGRKSLLGWDYGRYVFLCCWGYFVGYITEDEAWGRIMPAAGMLQKTFDSWKELGENYLIGREFWSLAQTRRDGQIYRDAHQRLLSDPGSPWNQLPWNLDLGATGARIPGRALRDRNGSRRGGLG